MSTGQPVAGGDAAGEYTVNVRRTREHRYRLSHQFILTSNTSAAGVPPQRSPRPENPSKRGTVSDPEQSRVHTKNSVEPGRYSHRSTALPRSERSPKLGSVTRTGGRGPGPSGSRSNACAAPPVPGFTGVLVEPGVSPY